MAKTRISVYLIKEGCDTDNQIIKEDNNFDCQAIDGVGNFYSKQSYSKVPKWVDSMFGTSIDSSSLRSSSASAVLLVPIEVEENKRRIFAITFGYGRLMIDQSSIEERFGLKAVLNIADANSLRRIDKTSVAGNAMKSSEQLPKKSSIGDFTMDIERDLLEGVSVSMREDGLLEGTVKGADALNASIEINMVNILNVLATLYDIYKSDAYKESFDWIDRISSVKSQALINRLDKKAISLINASSPDIWMAIPELIDWEQISGFRIVGDENLYQDILIDKVLASLHQPLTEIKQLKNRKVKALNSDETCALTTWSSYKCLFGELDLDGKQYCINGGKWYHVDNDYAQRIRESYELAPICNLPFPDWADGEHEKDYNESLQMADSESRALMDAKNIPYGGGSSRIELCDVLTNEGVFIHVKKYSGSAVLSHLFNQGLVSTQLIKSDDDFRTRAAEKLKLENPGFKFALDHNCVREVVYAIATIDDGERPPIPFFSKVTFYYVKKQFEMLGVPVSLKAVHVNDLKK